MALPSSPIQIVYCSRSSFKEEEWRAVRHELELDSSPGRKLGDLFDLEFRKVPTREPLLCNLEEMARFKAESAYEATRVPCIVEHAGLILEGFEASSFPGGLTQPMWDALQAERFVASCSQLSSKAIARAVIGYCDGMSIESFVGEMTGTLSETPKGNRAFYWDTVFCPDGFDGKTYAEIVGNSSEELLTKLKVSQSIKALKAFMEHRLQNEPMLFPGS